MEAKTKSRFEALLLPAIIAQSLIVGGGYSTGREIVQYAARFGQKGWLAVAVIFVGFSITCGLAFELTRQASAYDYKQWSQELVGPLWVLVDLLMLSILLLVIAVMSAAIGEVLQQTLGLAPLLGLVIAVGTVGLLTWKGSEFIERVKTFGSIALYIAYISFAVLVLTEPNLAAQADPTAVPPPTADAFSPDASWLEIVWTGALYIGYNFSVVLAVLFCLHRQTTRAETFTSGLLSGALMTVPFALTFACMMRFWPDPEIFGATVPWLPMLTAAGEARGGAALWIAIFGLVAGWTLLETAVGSIHALVDRISRNLEDLPAKLRPRSGRIEPRQRAALSVGFLLLAAGLSRFGVIDLVAKGYGALAWGFIFVVLLPLLTVGVRKVFAHR